jgi:hypothetical protein
LGLVLAACSLVVDLSGLNEGMPTTEAGSEAAVSSDASNADAAVTCTADVANDPVNCGTCGHSCLGGACTNGVCASVSLASATGIISTLVCDDQAVYYMVTSGSISRKTLDDKPASTLFTGSIVNATSPFGLALDTTHVYFFGSQGGNQLSRVTKDALTVETVAYFSLDFDDLSEAISISDAGIYADTYYQDDSDAGGGSRIWNFNALDGGANIVLAQSGAFFEDIVSDGQQLYFSNSNDMNSIALTGGNPTTIDTGDNHPQQNTNVGTNSTGIAWVTSTGGAVRWISATGQNVSVIASGSGVQSVALDEQNLYATVIDNADASDLEGTVVATSLASGAQTTLASLQNDARQLIRCPSYLAWVVDDDSQSTSAVQIIAR